MIWGYPILGNHHITHVLCIFSQKLGLLKNWQCVTSVHTGPWKNAHPYRVAAVIVVISNWKERLSWNPQANICAKESCAQNSKHHYWWIVLPIMDWIISTSDRRRLCPKTGPKSPAQYSVSILTTEDPAPLRSRAILCLVFQFWQMPQNLDFQFYVLCSSVPHIYIFEYICKKFTYLYLYLYICFLYLHTNSHKYIDGWVT